jgi:hypothetical protein
MRETPLEVSLRYVGGIRWPANKADVLEAMKRNGAPEDVLQTVRSFWRERYASPADVHGALWLSA